MTNEDRLESEQVEFIGRLCELACAECEKCAIGLQPHRVNGHWRHGNDVCRAGETHARISDYEMSIGQDSEAIQ